MLKTCAGFGWSRINLLPSSNIRAMFWICAGNTADNRDVIAIAEPCSQRVKAFPAAHITPEKLGEHRRPGRDTDGTADPK